jgi:cutinase
LYVSISRMTAVEAVHSAIRSFRTATRWLIVVTTALLACGTLVAAVAVAPAAADPCPNAEVVFARGTDEPPGIGRVGQAFVYALQSQVGGKAITAYGVNYPATYDFLAAADGAVDASARIAARAQQCPATRIVLGGYSQGAAVVDMLVGIPPLGNKIGDIGSAAPLSASLASNVAAIAVFGNPATKFGNPVTAARGPFGGVAIDMCSDGDPICSHGRNPFAHKKYENNGMAEQAAGFVAGLV